MANKDRYFSWRLNIFKHQYTGFNIPLRNIKVGEDLCPLSQSDAFAEKLVTISQLWHPAYAYLRAVSSTSLQYLCEMLVYLHSNPLHHFQHKIIDQVFRIREYFVKLSQQRRGDKERQLAEIYYSVENLLDCIKNINAIRSKQLANIIMIFLSKINFGHSKLTEKLWRMFQSPYCLSPEAADYYALINNAWSSIKLRNIDKSSEVSIKRKLIGEASKIFTTEFSCSVALNDELKKLLTHEENHTKLNNLEMPPIKKIEQLRFELFFFSNLQRCHDLVDVLIITTNFRCGMWFRWLETM